MGDLFGDAFAEDSAHRFFGRDIFDQNSQLSFPDSGDLAVSKSNNVSFLKVDDLDPDLRNILVVGESFICYSVTAKRTSIRAIDTVSGEKALLKGHESSILDLKLSVSDSQTFCSVDCGADTSKSHVFVWKRADGKSLDFKLALQSKLSAKMVQSFPKGDAWGISDGRRIGILTSENASATQYNQLPYYISVDDGVITEFSFSPTGDHVAALVSIDRDVHYTQIWRLLDSGRVEKVSPNFWRVSNAVALVFLSDFIVTVSRDSQSSDPSQGSRDSMYTIPYAVNLWSTADLFAGGVPASPPRNIQTLLLHVPEYRFRGKSTSLINPSLECDLRLEPNNGRYLILSSRKSNVLACLALSPSGSSALPIYHVTYLDFKAPIVSMDIATILGREHHSSEEGEHVEVTAYQEEAADQSSIQQYHVLVKSLFDFSKYGAPSSSPAHGSVSPSPAASSNNSPHGHPSAAASTILGMLNRAPGASSSPSILPSKGSFSSTVGTPSTGDNLVRTVPKSQQGSSSNSSQLEYTPTALTADKSALDALQSRSVTDGTATKNTASTPATPRNATTTDAAVVSELPDFLRTAATPKSHNSILSAFNRTNIHHNNSASASAGANGLSAILSAEKPPAALSFAAVASSNASNAPTSTATSNSSTSAIKPSTVTTHAPVASAAGVSGSKKLLSSLTASTPASTASAATSSGTVEPSTIASPTPAVASGPTKNLLSVLGKATTSPPPPPPPVVPASPATYAPSTPTSSSVHTTVNSGELKQNILREMHHLHTVTMTEMRTLLHQQHQVAQRNMQDLMTQTKTDLTNQLTETLTNKVQQQLSNKLKESMRDTIRDSMRSYLQDAFRNAFESSLLPAFQSGIDRMFEQVNSSVDDGMDGVLTVLQEQHQEAVDARTQIVSQVSEAAATLMKDRNNTVSDNNSVGVTPEMIGSMMKAMINVETMWKRTEQTVSQLQEMMAQMQSVLVAGGSLENAGMQAGAIIQANRKPTADELLSQGKIAEAIICALDNKNIDETVAILAKLSPAVVNQKCSPLVRLCITQQLASDLSVNAPSEGIAKRLEWIKSLVATIVRIPKPEFDANVNLKRNFPSMIQAVLESIQAAKGWIARAQYDNGEDDDATVDIPHSVHTDLELLEIVVQTASW